MDSNEDNEPGPSKRRVGSLPTSETENISDENAGIHAPQNVVISSGTNEEEEESPNLVISGGDFAEVQFGKKRNQASVKLVKHITAATTQVHHYGPDDKMISSSTSQQSVEESESMYFEGCGDNPQKVQTLMEQALITANEDLTGITNRSASRQAIAPNRSDLFQISHGSGDDSEPDTDYQQQIHSSPSDILDNGRDESTAPKQLRQELVPRHLQCQASGSNNSNDNDETIASRSSIETPDHQLEPSMQISQLEPSMVGTMANPSAGGELQLRHEPEQPIVVAGGNFEGVHIGPQSNQQIIEAHQHLTRQETHHHYHLGSAQEKQSPEKCAEFLERVKTHFNKTNRSINDGNFAVRPTMMLADMERKKQGNAASIIFNKADPQFGHDIKEIGLNNLYDEHNNKIPRHVMMLGDLGAGKTTLSSTYAELVNDGKVDNMKNIKLVHFVRASHLQTDSLSTAFDLIFTDQMAGDPETDLNGLKEAGQYWLEKNSDKLLVVIDGLDQFTNGLHHVNKNINYSTKAKADVILANIMSGKIWFGAKIMTTSRWLIYSKLKPDQRPNKVVALRGFSDESMKEAAQNLVLNTNLQDDITTYLREAEPGLQSLCKNPMFLSYTAEVFLQNPSDIPENLSGLMAAVFLQFVRSPHCGFDDLENLENVTKLAYHGMVDNKFSFTENYIKKLGIDPKTLKGPIVSSAILQPGQAVATTADQKHSFSHQSMQELFAALHLFRLNRVKVSELVSGKLNDDNMEIVRKLFYGMVMNEKTRGMLVNYIEDLPCSLAECQEIIINQFHSLLSGGVINGIKIVSLLCECGPGIIAKLGVDISEIQFGDDELSSAEDLALVVVIPQCTALRLVQFKFLDLRSRPLLKLHPLSIGKMYVEYLLVMDDAQESDYDIFVQFLDTARYDGIALRGSDEMKKALLSYWVRFDKLFLDGVSSTGTFRFLGQFLALFRLNMLFLYQTGCTQEKLDVLNFESEKFSPQIKTLVIEDPDLTTEGFVKLAGAVGKSSCSELQLVDCRLSVEKLQIFGGRCQDGNIKIQTLIIKDPDLTTEGYGELARTVGKSSCSELRFTDCRLSVEKLQIFGGRCQDGNIKIQSLIIKDPDLTTEGFGELARTVGKSSCSKLRLVDCRLSVEKLQIFVDRCQDGNTKIENLEINDPDLTMEGFGELARTVGKSSCSELGFDDCRLSVEKLQIFGGICQDENIKIETLIIKDPDLTTEGFGELARTVGKSSCSEIRLVNCRLSVEKLQIFGGRCQDGNIKIKSLAIKDPDLATEGFGELARTFGKSSCSELRLVDCRLSVEKLQIFGGRCQDGNIKIKTLIIEDPDLTTEGFVELARTVGKSSCSELRFADCRLSVEKLQIFGGRCQDGNIKIETLQIEDPDLTTESFGELARTVGKSSCSEIRFLNCGLSVEKLQIFGGRCQDGNIKINSLKICEEEIGVTDEIISVLCDLMHNVVEALSIYRWQLHEVGRERLRSAFSLPTSVVRRLQLPGEHMLRKRYCRNPDGSSSWLHLDSS